MHQLLPSADHGRPFRFLIGRNTVPDRVVPYPDESLLSVLTRMVGASGHSHLSALADRVGMDPNAMEQAPWSPDRIAALADAAGYPEHEIERRMYVPVDLEGQVQNYVRFGVTQVRATFLSTRRRAVSPASLRLAPYHRMMWDVTHLGCCPESMEPLIDRCPNPNCGKQLAWRGNSVCHCHICDFDLRDAKLKKIRPWQRDRLTKLAALLSPSNEISSEAKTTLPFEIQTLEPGEILYAAMLLGIALSTKTKTAMARLRTRIGLGSVEKETTELLNSGMQLLCDLDEYFDDFLSEQRNTRTDSVSVSPVRSYLGALYDLIDPAVVGINTASIFSERVRRHYTEHYSKLKFDCHSVVLLRWCHQVMDADEMLSVAPSKFLGRKMLGIPQIRVGPRNVSKTLAFDRFSVHELVEEINDAVAISKLVTESGMPKKIITDLIDKKILRGSSNTVQMLLGPDRASRSDWQRIMQSFEDNTETSPLAPIKFSSAVALLGGKILAGKGFLS